LIRSLAPKVLSKKTNVQLYRNEGKKMKIQKKWKLLALLVTVPLCIIVLAFPYELVSSRIRVVDLAPPSPTSISCSVLSASVTLDNSTTVSGSISPPVSNVTVTLTYTKPDATTMIRTVTTGANGSYSDTYTPNVVGSWRVKAYWTGNDNYFGSTSFDATFIVREPAAAGFPIEYAYVAVIVIIVVFTAIAVYLLKRKNSKSS
jgi:hypothetical protein